MDMYLASYILALFFSQFLKFEHPYVGETKVSFGAGLNAGEGTH